jgi:hypothetical protein
MEHNLTPELVKYLYEEGYMILYAKGQIHEEDLVFKPLYIPIHEFYEYDSFDDAILTIEEALKLPFEVLLNHKVII